MYWNFFVFFICAIMYTKCIHYTCSRINTTLSGLACTNLEILHRKDHMTYILNLVTRTVLLGIIYPCWKHTWNWRKIKVVVENVLCFIVSIQVKWDIAYDPETILLYHCLVWLNDPKINRNCPRPWNHLFDLLINRDHPHLLASLVKSEIIWVWETICPQRWTTQYTPTLLLGGVWSS